MDDIKTLLPYIITAAVSLISIVATSAVSIALSKSNYKRELAKLEHDYRLRQINSSLQVKSDSYKGIFKTMTTITDSVLELSVEAHKYIQEAKRANIVERNKEQISKLNDIRNRIDKQKSEAFFVASGLCDYYFSSYYTILHRIIMESCKDNDPIDFFGSLKSSGLIFALQNMQNNFLYQARMELNIVEYKNFAIFALRESNHEGTGFLIKRADGEVELLAGSYTKRPLEGYDFDFWSSDDGYYNLSHNISFESIKEAATYLIGTDKKYEVEPMPYLMEPKVPWQNKKTGERK